MYNSENGPENERIMKKLIYCLILVVLAFSSTPGQPARAQTGGQPEDNSGAVVCQPGVYLQPPADCLPLGPSEYLTQMAQLGLNFPIQPLDASPADPALKALPYSYYWITSSAGTGFYPSIAAAQDKQGASQVIPPGSLIFIVYTQRNDTDHGTYFLLPSGEWMPGDGSTYSISDAMPGLEFHSTPRSGFAWVIEQDAPVRSQPNFLKNSIIGTLPQYKAPNSSVVQVFSIQSIDGVNWAMIGPNEWMRADQLAIAFPNTTPPPGVTNGRWIDVDLAGQTISVYDHQQLVFATVMASGLGPNWTRPGLFQIYKKKPVETMSGDQGTPDFYYLQDVPWTMYFDKARALHGAYWRARLGYPQSHGCVNMTIGDAHWLYNWANVGDWVYVHDPSGATPSDPADYGDGGA